MEIHLKEKFMLLALDDRKGNREKGSYYFNTALSSCIILDMVMLKILELRDKKLHVNSSRIPSDPIYRDVYRRIRKKNKEKSLKYWMADINSRIGKYRKIILQHLVSARILRREKRRFLGIPYSLYPTLNPAPENDFRRRLTESVRNLGSLDEHDLALLAVLQSSKSLQILFRDKNQRKMLEKDLKEALAGNLFGKAVQETIDQMTAVIVTTVVTTGAVH